MGAPPGNRPRGSESQSISPKLMTCLAGPSLTSQAFRAYLQLVASVNERRGGPRLKGFSHRPTGAAVNPFVEFPVLVFAETIDLRELEQFPAGHIAQTQPVDEAHPHATDERPDAA